MFGKIVEGDRVYIEHSPKGKTETILEVKEYKGEVYFNGHGACGSRVQKRKTDFIFRLIPSHARKYDNIELYFRSFVIMIRTFKEVDPNIIGLYYNKSEKSCYFVLAQ